MLLCFCLFGGQPRWYLMSVRLPLDKPVANIYFQVSNKIPVAAILGNLRAFKVTEIFGLSLADPRLRNAT